MAGAEQAAITAPAFAVVRRGYDPEQVARHLNRIEAETALLAADRAAVVEQARHLSQQLVSHRKKLDAARAEIERLRGELRVLAGPPDTIDSMNERLQVMLRLAKDEFIGLQANASTRAAAHTAEIIAAIGADAGDAGGFGFDESELRRPRDEEELERMRREAAAERARLDEDAAARRAAADEEFRRVLALRCREAMAQLAKLQTEALRSTRRMMDDAGEQAHTVLAEADEAVSRAVEDAQREVDGLQKVRLHLASRLETSRQLLDRAIPAARTAQRAAAAAGNGDSGATSGSAPRSILAAEPASPVTPAEQAPTAPPPAPQAPNSAPAAAPSTQSGSDSIESAAPAGSGLPGAPSAGQHPAEETPQLARTGRHAPGSAPATTTSTGTVPPSAPASAGRHRSKQAGPPQVCTSVSSGDTGSAPPDGRSADASSAGLHRGKHAVTTRLPPPALPAPASLPAPPGWPVVPGSYPAQSADAAEPVRHAAADPGSVLEQTQPAGPDPEPGVSEAGAGPRVQPKRSRPRDPESSDVSRPSRIPLDEQDPQVAQAGGRYP